MTNKLRVYENMAGLIANPSNPTPMVRLSERINPNPLEIYLKLEWFNPWGSVKDRIAKYMLDGVEIREDQTLIEASSGNTAISLAALANILKMRKEIAVPERIPDKKKLLLKLLGVEELWEAPDDLCPVYPNEGARGLVESIVNDPDNNGKYVNPNQYVNELNVKAHYETTGPEIWKQTQGEIDYFFAGIGTGGTITGVGRYLKEQKPSVKIIGIEPDRAEHNLPGMKRISDLAEDYIPKILDMSVIDYIVQVSDHDAYQTGIRLIREEAILGGPTTGAIAHVALKFAANLGIAVGIAADKCTKYIDWYIERLENEIGEKIELETN